MRIATAIIALVLSGLASAEALPGVVDAQRAQVNYMLNCQGCHGPDGDGTHDGAVPTMKNFVGNFLHVPGGRSFLIQVPGSANSALTDAALAEVVNWMLFRIAPAQLPVDFEPYSADEVGRLRKQPLVDVLKVREELLARMEGSP